jgi:hypothetical protein
MARTTSTGVTRRGRSFMSHKVTRRRDEIMEQLEAILYDLFRAKCKDLKIEVNKRSWELFLKTFSIKNTIREGKIATVCLNLAHFSLTPSCLCHINTLIEISAFKTVNLSKNLIDPTQIRSLTTIQELILNNCKLGNDIL